MKTYFNTLLKKAGISLVSGVFLVIWVTMTIFVVQAFQTPSGGDTTPSTAGYTSASSWISTNITSIMGTLTAIKTKTDTITTPSTFCDPNVGKYCNIKPATCDATEASVVVDASKGTGYCIEKTERVSATFAFAKITCEGLGKRLPEPFEWSYACKNAGTLGLSTMTGNWEWAGNTVIPMYNSTEGLGAALFGANGCSYGDWAWVANSWWSETPAAYRCAR